jgi:hypothetical protein
LGNKEEFRNFLIKAIENPDVLRSIVDENIVIGAQPLGIMSYPKLPSFIIQASYQDIVGVKYQKLK